MTLEQKVEKLRGIVDKKIAIWCETRKEREDFTKIAIEIRDEEFEVKESRIPNQTCYNMGYDSYGYDFCYVDWYKKEGFQIIPYSEFFKDDKVDKPLEDWTLLEARQYAEKQCEIVCGCTNCLVKNICQESVETWFFESDKPSLTQSEIDILKAIKVLYGGDSKILYAESIDCFVDDDDTCQIPTFNIEADRLPSLSHDKEYNINELLKEV